MIFAENAVMGEIFSHAKFVQGHFIQVVLQVLEINYNENFRTVLFIYLSVKC
jgi:hypothetical protein